MKRNSISLSPSQSSSLIDQSSESKQNKKNRVVKDLTTRQEDYFKDYVSSFTIQGETVSVSSTIKDTESFNQFYQHMKKDRNIYDTIYMVNHETIHVQADKISPYTTNLLKKTIPLFFPSRQFYIRAKYASSRYCSDSLFDHLLYHYQDRLEAWKNLTQEQIHSINNNNNNPNINSQHPFYGLSFSAKWSFSRQLYSSRKPILHIYLYYTRNNKEKETEGIIENTERVNLLKSTNNNKSYIVNALNAIKALDPILWDHINNPGMLAVSLFHGPSPGQRQNMILDPNQDNIGLGTYVLSWMKKHHSTYFSLLNELPHILYHGTKINWEESYPYPGTFFSPHRSKSEHYGDVKEFKMLQNKQEHGSRWIDLRHVLEDDNFPIQKEKETHVEKLENMLGLKYCGGFRSFSHIFCALFKDQYDAVIIWGMSDSEFILFNPRAVVEEKKIDNNV